MMTEKLLSSAIPHPAIPQWQVPSSESAGHVSLLSPAPHNRTPNKDLLDTPTNGLLVRAPRLYSHAYFVKPTLPRPELTCAEDIEHD